MARTARSVSAVVACLRVARAGHTARSLDRRHRWPRNWPLCATHRRWRSEDLRVRVEFIIYFPLLFRSVRMSYRKACRQTRSAITEWWPLDYRHYFVCWIRRQQRKLLHNIARKQWPIGWECERPTVRVWRYLKNIIFHNVSVFWWNFQIDQCRRRTCYYCALPNTFHAISDEYGGRDQCCQEEDHSVDQENKIWIDLSIYRI